MKRYWKVLAVLFTFALGIASVVPPAVKASSVLTTTTAIQRLQPFVVMQTTSDSATGAAVGGIVKYYITKSTDTLKICDVVFIDTLNAVSKSTTLANYNKLAGVVVGGRSTSMQASVASADCGSTASLPNRPVIVLRSGRFWVQVDTQVAGLTAGTLIRPSQFTAGKVAAKATSIDSLFRTFGRSLNGGAASSTVLADINAK